MNLEPRLPLLRTKISIPLLPTEFVHRHRLTEKLTQGIRGPLTLVSAPAGFGKTNLLVEWASETKSPVAWLTIDEEDNEPGRFFPYLIGAFQILEPQLGEEALDFIQSTKSQGLEMGLTLFINEVTALPRDLILVLDEFQVLDSAIISKSLNFLLKHLPPNLHLVIASRSEPALDLAWLRAKSRVFELGADDLRFTAEEIALLFRETTGWQLAPETLAVVEKKTDGWITGLQMAALSSRHQADPANLLKNLQGDAHHLVDFLAEEVLSRQPEEIRQFLLQSSVLDRFCGPLCEAVFKPECQPGYGSVILDRLEQANLFIVSLDERHEWFRYHHLFADFLRHVHEKNNPTEIPEMKKRAALWFERQADLDEAIKYALDAGDEDWTANLIERNIEEMIKTGELFALTHWIEKLSDEVIRRRPPLSLAYAWGLIAAMKLDTARYWVEIVEKDLDQLEKPDEDAENTDAEFWNMFGGLAVCQSALALLSGDFEQATKFSNDAAHYLREDNPFIYSLYSLENSLYFVLAGDTSKAIDSLRETTRIARQANNQPVIVIATCQLAEEYALQGRLSQALTTLQKAQLIATAPNGAPLPLAGIVDVGFGEILLERNELDQAREYLERGSQTTQSLWPPLSSLDIVISLAHLYQIQGEIDAVQKIVDDASRLALGAESTQWDNAIVSSVAARLALQRADLAAALQWWKKGGFADITEKLVLEDYPYQIFEFLQLTQVRFLLAQSWEIENQAQLPWASELLEPLLRTAKRFKRVTSQIEILVLQSLIQATMENLDRATEILLDALALGEPEGYRRIFLDEGQRLADLLANCQEVRETSRRILPSAGYIESLLQSIQPFEQVGQKQGPITLQAKTDYGLPISLSTRELEVLSLIAEGKSNQEISAQLYLALNTVKRHAYNIYAKLEVKKRTHAVLKARQLGLIP